MYAGSMLARERLREWIDAKCGGNQSELARRIGESPNWVNWRVTGTTQIKADELPKIARGLGIDPCQLIPDSDEKGRTTSHEAGGFSAPPVSIVGERAGRMLEKFLAQEMGLAPEHVQAVSTIVLSLARSA